MEIVTDPLEKTYLALVDRVRTKIQSPRAQIEQHVVIPRCTSDPDWVWNRLVDELRNTDGLNLEIRGDGSLFLYWYLNITY